MDLLRKNIVILTLLIIVSGTLFSQEDHSLKFKKGVELYTASKYDEALKEWLDIYNEGYRSASLEYNIGNAYFKLNNIPGAILFYERALLIRPAGENIHYNLEIARTLVVDKFNEIPQLFFIKWFDFISLTVSTNGWAIISIILFLISLLLLSLYIYSSRYRLKVIAFWIALLMFFFSAFSLAFSLRNKTLVYNSREAIIFAPMVNGKSSPDSSGTDLFVLHDGSKVKIEDEVGSWYEIKLSDGNKGWVPVNSLEII
jgi:tetratricopeptide (TPR) repeat protein